MSGPIVHCFYIYWSLSPWCSCQIYVQCSCLQFFQAIELSIETLFPYYTYIFAQKILCLHTFTIYVHNTKSKKKQCLNCWLYECTLLDKESIDLKALVKAINSKVRRSFDFSGDDKCGLCLSIELSTQLLFSHIYQSKLGFPLCANFWTENYIQVFCSKLSHFPPVNVTNCSMLVFNFLRESYAILPEASLKSNIDNIHYHIS